MVREVQDNEYGTPGTVFALTVVPSLLLLLASLAISFNGNLYIVAGITVLMLVSIGSIVFQGGEYHARLLMILRNANYGDKEVLYILLPIALLLLSWSSMVAKRAW